MPFEEAKIYYDGSHYIAIPHTEGPPKKSTRKPPEETIIVGERETTRKELFEDLYAEAEGKTKRSKQKEIREKMQDFFEDKQDAAMFVEENIERKKRNMDCRRIRMFRKAALQEFNYFCTFTYDPKKMDEIAFKKKLSYVFRHRSHRNGWKYIGVWERSPEAKRLHFHGVFYIPEGTMPGTLEKETGYSTTKGRRQNFSQNTYFAERFGRNEMDEIEDETLAKELLYMIKYIEKTGERIVYSKGLPQYFISDIMDDDVICRYGIGDSKLLLRDGFACYDQGEFKGQVAPEVIAEMRKEN